MVDYKISRLRGTPLGCKRIHSLTAATVDFCDIQPNHTGYMHPLIKVEAWQKMDEKEMTSNRPVEMVSQLYKTFLAAYEQIMQGPSGNRNTIQAQVRSFADFLLGRESSYHKAMASLSTVRFPAVFAVFNNITYDLAPDNGKTGSFFMVDRA